MEGVMDKAPYSELFLFAAKIGSLEGYLFQRQKVEPLTNWVDNISQMYQELSPVVKREVNPVVVTVLERTLKYGDDTLEPALKAKLQELLAAAGKES
jgi:hypothetical protein